MDLADLVYEYPDINDPLFQEKITAKYEFSSLRTAPVEPVPPRGQPFNHQAIILRYMLQYDRLFLIHEAGTGKTCSSVFAAEVNLQKDLAASLANYLYDYILPQKSSIKHIYVITRGPTLADEFKYQIICKCTTQYDNDFLNSTLKTSVRDRKINASLARYYTILTYGGLAKENQELSDEQIAEKFAHSFFIIDEPQYLAQPELAADADPTNYDGLLRIFRLARNSKVIASTATPMISSVQEIAPMLNLVLPLEKALPTNVDYSQVTLEDLAPRLQGYVSYIRSFDTGIEIVPQGEVVENIPIVNETVVDEEGLQVLAVLPEAGLVSQVVVYARTMGQFQNAVYQNESTLTSGERNVFYNRERQISNFVFPNGTWGTEGFSQYITVNGDIFTPKPDLGRSLQISANFQQNLANLAEFGCKASAVIELLEEIPGNHFIYSNSKVGSGAGLLAALLILFGYSQFVETESVFGQKEVSENQYCLSSTPSFIEKRIILSPARRFAILTPETPPGRRRSLLEVFNSYENRHGQYIKVLITPPVGKAGINLSNVVAIHLFDPDWNEAGNYQAIYRSIRATSHIALLREAKERAQAEGRDPSNVRVEVRLFRHVAQPISPEYLSIDLNIYLLAEQRDIFIRRMLRILKQLAFDCQLTRASNIRPGDKEGSQACDYSSCNYLCWNEAPSEIDYSSFNVLYSSPYIEKIITGLIDFFSYNFVVSISSLTSLLPETSEMFILAALSRLIKEKRPLRNRYGLISYLRAEGNYVYLDTSLSGTASSLASAFYTENLLALEEIPLATLTIRNSALSNSTTIYTLLGTSPQDPGWQALYESLDLNARVQLLETSLLLVNNLIEAEGPVQENSLKEVLKRLQSSYYSLHEPTPALQSYASNLQAQNRPALKRTRGRPRKGDKPVAFTDEDMGSVTLPNDTGEVVIHVLYDSESGNAGRKVGVTRKPANSRLRILVISEGRWRDANDIEKPVYLKLFNQRKNQSQAPITAQPIYGLVRGQTFALVIKEKANSRPAKKGDARNNRTGRNCQTTNKAVLVQVMWQIGVAEPQITVTASEEDILTDLRDKTVFTPENPEETFRDDPAKALYFFKWLNLGKQANKISILCDLIRNTLENQNLLAFEP